MSPSDLIRNGFCQFLTVWLVRILIEHSCQLFSSNSVQTFCCADSFLLIQAKIQRSIHLKRKSSLRVIDLHRRYAKICQNKIKSAYLFCDLINGTEILKFDRQHILTKPLLLQTFSGLCRLFRVHICGIHMPLALQTLQHGFRMTAIAKSRIKSDLSRLDLQKIQDLIHHNRDMHSCRSISLLDHMLDRILIFFRLQLLIFFFKFLRVFSLIPYTALMRRLWILFHIHPFLLIKNL